MSAAPEQLDLDIRPYPPESDWTPPATLPDRLYGPIGFDLETRDDGIQAGKGSAWPWRGGKVVGYSVAADNFRAYLPVAHEGGGNMDGDVVRRWLNDVLADESQPKIGANIMYDVGWANVDGVQIRGPLIDIQWAEALLDEHRWSYSLQSIAKTRLNREKDETLLREAARQYGVDPKGGLWKLPAPMVGAYGEEDAVLPRDIWEVQRPLIEAEGLSDLLRLECDLIPMYVDMRRRGVRVDVDRAEKLRRQWDREIQELVSEIHRRVGIRVDIWSAASIAQAFEKEGLSYGRTAKGAPSITKSFLAKTDHWLAKAIVAAREKSKLAGTFIDGVILDNLHDGRVHGEIHPLRSDDGGTITGRLSMSNPNLQFIPTRTKEGNQVRGCFLPEEGELWSSADFSQQEPRLLVHFASLTRYRGRPLPGAAEARDRYRSDPTMSYHKFVEEITGLPYKAAKILNLAIVYGRGVAATAAELGITKDEAKEMFDRHAAEIPFAKQMAYICQDVVRARGEIRSLLGRKQRFPNYEPLDWDKRDGRAYPLWRAKKEWPGEKLQRARLHKALNALIQPSAADQMKAAMRAVWRAGLGGYVKIQVHDELGSSVPSESVAREIADVMRDAVQLEVPSVVDVEIGPDWGACSEG